MAIGGAFLGGGAEIVPAGFCKLELEILTEDRNNLSATFTIKGTSTYTVTAGADGRAVYTVPSGQTYTVSVNTTGYDNLASQTVVAESGTVRYVRFEAFEGRVKRSGDTMTGNLGIKNAQPSLHLSLDDTGSYGNVDFINKDGQCIGLLRGQMSDGENRAIIAVGRPGTNTIDYLLTAINKGDKPYVLTTTPSDKTDNTDRIATTAWVNSADSVVHKTGNETIAGTKTFTSSPYLSGGQLGYMVKRTDMALGGNWTRYRWDRVKDKNDKDVMELVCTNDQNATYSRLISHNYVDGNDVVGEIGVYVKTDGTAYGLAPTTPSNATSNEIATADWSIGKFVQKSGDTMTGNLFIEASSNRFVYIKRADLDRDVEQVFPTSGTTTVGGFIVVDKDGGAIAGINRAVSPSEVSVTLQNSQTVNGTLRHCNLSLKIAKDGSMYTTVPTPSDSSDNSTKIATTAWINSASSVVHTTGNETIAGRKTFDTPLSISNSGNLNWANPSNIRGEKGGSEQNMNFVDANGTPTARIHHYVNSNNLGSILYLETYNKKSDGTTVSASIIAVANTDGTSYALAPTTPTNATSNVIATANWVNGKLANRVQKLTMSGTITDGEVVTTDIQANDTVIVSITSEGVVTPVTFTVDIPSTVENATAVRSSSHIVRGSDGKAYALDLFVQYRKGSWYISTGKNALSNTALVDSTIKSFSGHILRV